MRHPLFLLAAAAGLACAGVAPAQRTITSTNRFNSYNPTYNVGGYGGYGPYYGNFVSQPFSDYFSGVASLTSAQGQYLQDQQQARLLNQEVESQKLDYRRKQSELRAYELSLQKSPEQLAQEERERALRRALNDPPFTEILSADSLNTLFKNMKDLASMGVGTGPTIPLDQDMLKHINVTSGGGGNIGLFREGAKLKWPFALRDTPWDDDRKKMQELADKAVKDVVSDELSPQTVREMKSTLAHMESVIADNGATISMAQSIEAQRYIDELRASVKALESPNAANYLNKKWAPQGNTVGELVGYMTQQGLLFAPAVRGDEPAYRYLYQTMVSYDRGLNALARK
jgi:hypothetical protein